MATLLRDFSTEPAGSVAESTHVATGTHSNVSGKVLVAGITTGQRGGFTLDESAPATLLHCLTKMEMIAHPPGWESPCGGVLLKYTQLVGSLFQGIRVDAKYDDATDIFTLSLACATSGLGTFFTGVYSTAGIYNVAAGAEVQQEVEFYLSGTTPKVRGRIWPTLATQPGWLFDVAIGAAGHAINALAGPGGAIDLATAAGGINTQYRSLLLTGNWPVPPDAPSVAVSEIRRTTVKATPSAYSHPDSLAHAARRARVRRVSDDTIEVASHSVALSGAFYLTGLPEGPSGANGRPAVDPDLVVEVQDEDEDGLLSDWGTSDPFQTLNLWESGEFITHLDVQIEREAVGGGTEMQSYRDFGGRNWIKSLKLEPAGVDRPIGSGVLTLVREAEGDSLAPAMTGSPLNIVDGDYSPALDFQREIEVLACIKEPNTEPDPEDFAPLFGGLTDDPEWPRKVGDVSVPFRDYTAALAETVILDEARYGDPDTPPDYIDVMQEVADDELGAGEVTVWDRTTGPGFAVTRAAYVDISPLEAVQNLAQVAGGKRIEQGWNPDDEAWQLGVIEPDRAKSVPDYEIGPNVYLEVHKINTQGASLRTIVRGECVDRETGALLTSQLPAAVDVPTDPIVSKYGRRPLVFRESSETSPIDSQAELDDMVAAIYSDVSSMPIPLEFETKFAPFVQVDDLIRIKANGRTHDEDQDVAVLTVTHDFPSPGVGRTRFIASGKPKGAMAAWLRRDVQIAGRNPRAGIFDMVLTQEGTGAATQLVLVNDLNSQTERWAAFSRLDSDPRTGGVPDEGTSRGDFKKAETVTTRWPVRDGTHYVLVRAYAGEDQRAFAERLETITITGVGGGGSPGTEAPTLAPLTPNIFGGAITGSDRDAEALWVNTDEAADIESEYLLSGAPQGIRVKSAGDTTDVTSFPIGSKVAVRVRYTQGAGLEGPWATSASTILTDAA